MVYPRQEKASCHIWEHDYLHKRTLVQSIQRHTHKVQGDILDLGCGYQPYRDWFSGQGTYVGLDPDSVDASPNVVATAAHLPFGCASFDAVISFQVFEHLREPWLVWREIARVLRPGSIVLITTHQAFRLHEEPFDYFRYTCYGLKAMAERAGFEILVTEPHGGVWTMVGQALLSSFMVRMPGWIYLFLKLPIALWNLFFLVMDYLWLDLRDTMNYLVVARRRS